MSQRTGVYPGTFDPITLGHLDIVRRSLKMVDRLVIGVATNPGKEPLFTLEERVGQVSRETKGLGAETGATIEVVPFDKLLVQFAQDMKAVLVIRGLRAASDFEYEFQMAGMNAALDPEIETVFLMADAKLQPIASRLVKEIASFGGDIAPFVTPPIAAEVAERVGELHQG
ncbi:MAG: pantetheine-phosphate adenylyltransferase [Sphingomonadales bacterium]